jgi:hypothetical protein
MLWKYGLSDDPSNTLYLTLLGVFIFYWLGWIIYTRCYHPLSKYPGPFLGSVSRSWLVAQVASGQAEVTQRALHDKLGTVSKRLLLYIPLKITGPIVRIAPNEVAIADPNALKTIYYANDIPHRRMASDLLKTDFYMLWGPRRARYPDSFTAVDETVHAARRKIVNHLYLMSSITQSEAAIDTCTAVLLAKLKRTAITDEAVDITKWIQWSVCELELLQHC